MELTMLERRALDEWMTAKGLSHAKVAKLLDVSAHSVTMWCHGGGVSPTKLSRLRRFIDPFIHAQALPLYDSSLPLVRQKLQQAIQLQPQTVKYFANYLHQLETFIAENDGNTPDDIDIQSDHDAPSEIQSDHDVTAGAPPITEDFPLIPCRISVNLIPLPQAPGKSQFLLDLESDGNHFLMIDKSMSPNYGKNEILAIKPFKDGALNYSPPNDMQSMVRKVYAQISPGTVVAVTINGAPMTCRRLIYQFRGMQREIVLTADRANTPGFPHSLPHSLKAQDSISIHGTVSRHSGGAN